MPLKALLRSVLTVAAFALPFAVPAHAAMPTPNAPASFADLAERLLPSVVNISSTTMESEDQPDDDDDGQQGMDNLPPGLQDFFQQYMQRYGQNGHGGGEGDAAARPAHRSRSRCRCPPSVPASSSMRPRATLSPTATW